MAEQRTITVDGMTCSGCERSVQSAVTRLDGVEQVAADHSAGTVEVWFDTTVVDEDTIREEIRQAGYAVPA